SKKDDDKKKDEPTKAEKIAAQRASIIKEAKAHLGVKYVWGGTSPKSGWDCSGYTQYVYGKHGIDLPRTTSQQRYAGKEISIKDAKAGDLIWIPGHIGIISETKGQMYDAGSPRTNTTKRSYSWMLDRGAKVIRVVGRPTTPTAGVRVPHRQCPAGVRFRITRRALSGSPPFSE